MAFCPAEVTPFVLAVNFGGGLCESNAPETDWPPAGFEDRKGHQPPMPSASRQGTREPGNDEGAKAVPYVSFFTGTGRLIKPRVSPIRLVSLMLSKYSRTVNAYWRLLPSRTRRAATVMLPCLEISSATMRLMSSSTSRWKKIPP